MWYWSYVILNSKITSSIVIVIIITILRFFICSYPKPPSHSLLTPEMKLTVIQPIIITSRIIRKFNAVPDIFSIPKNSRVVETIVEPIHKSMFKFLLFLCFLSMMLLFMCLHYYIVLDLNIKFKNIIFSF